MLLISINQRNRRLYSPTQIELLRIEQTSGKESHWPITGLCLSTHTCLSMLRKPEYVSMEGQTE